VHFILTPETGYTHFSIGYTNKVGINKTLVKQQHRDGTGSEPFRSLKASLAATHGSASKMLPKRTLPIGLEKMLLLLLTAVVGSVHSTTSLDVSPSTIVAGSWVNVSWSGVTERDLTRKSTEYICKQVRLL